MITTFCIVPKINGEFLVHDVCNKVRIETLNLGLHEVDIKHITNQTLIIAIGGDGTMLQAMRIAAKTNAIAVGINLGCIGFLTDFAPGQLDEFIHKANSLLCSLDHHKIEVRSILEHIDYDSETPTLACNEFSIAHQDSDSMIRYRLYIDGADAGIHRANSVLISTATGSTAYSLSAGGALMYPTANAMQIVPIAPMRLSSRPIIADIHSSVVVEAWGGNIVLRADGNKTRTMVSITNQEKFKFEFQKYSNNVRVLHHPNWNFFDVLSVKLGWEKE